MDEIDLQILRELDKDARTPFSTIAKKIEVNTQTVINRYNEMKKKGTIQFCAISIDLEEIGYNGSAHLLISSSPESNLSKTMEELKKISNMILVSKMIGDFEAYAVLPFKNVRNIYDTVVQIKMLPGVGNVDVSISIPGMKRFPHGRNML